MIRAATKMFPAGIAWRWPGSARRSSSKPLRRRKPANQAQKSSELIAPPRSASRASGHAVAPRLRSTATNVPIKLARLMLSCTSMAVPSRAFQARRVLVVDDNIDHVQMLALLLKGMGHQTEIAVDAQAAINAARRFRPDVVILDLALPDMDGTKLCRQLRQE